MNGPDLRSQHQLRHVSREHRVHWIIAYRHPVEWEGDRRMEARLGARLHIWALNQNLTPSPRTADNLDVRATYDRWAVLHRAGKAGRLASEVTE